ncbi:MAG TPA: right-handed parallel beta-helix repeat-containing protein [Solirubrobacteraceae bacterium]|jgi:hypothetical protein
MSRRGNRWTMVLAAAAVGLVAPAAAPAHLERPSYWPDPAPDRSVRPAAGGEVPEARSLRSAVTGEGRGEVRVVCRGKTGGPSLELARKSIFGAYRNGYRLRPSQPKRYLSKEQARSLYAINVALREKCAYSSIQEAVNDSGNNDRIVIMPGTYTEPDSRKAPDNDPRCNPSLLQKDASGDNTPSYEYQVTCPNDQNLVFVAGREVVGDPLPEPRDDRQGIPEQELGRCIRCNLQIEGSGAKPEDVIIDAGTDYDGTGAEARPGGHAKHVALRADRADGFVGRNMLMRGAREFGFYTEETDGVLLDRTKFFWNADYGHLSFTTDHNLIKNCDGMGAGDAAIYPGAAPETGSQATSFYPDAPRYNTTVTKCDMRNSALGYSGSMGNAVRITNNHIYGNTTGIASDTLSSAGHPGFPADSAKIDNNFIYANNFNTYAEDSPVKPLVGVPIGVGVVYAGMNDARVHDNWFFDNWRMGTMLFSVPDALTSNGGAEGAIFPGISCAGAPENGLSTSCGNQYFGNRMGDVPKGFEFPETLDRYGVPHGDAGEASLPNGHDFWWDEFLSNRWNCWYDNTSSDGSTQGVDASGTGVPPNLLPDCAGGRQPDLSVGYGDVAKEAYLIDCADGPGGGTGMACDWWTAPAKPGSAEAEAQAREMAEAARLIEASPQGAHLQRRIDAVAGLAGG